MSVQLKGPHPEHVKELDDKRQLSFQRYAFLREVAEIEVNR